MQRLESRGAVRPICGSLGVKRLSMGGINCDWLAVWVLGSDWLCRKLEVTFVRRLGEAAAPGGGECGLCPDFASYILAFALQLRKNHGKTSVRVMRYDKLRLVSCRVLCGSSIQILFVLRSLSTWMWRCLLFRVSEMVTSLVAMHTGRHTPYVVVTTEVGLRVKSQVGFFACHGNQMTVAVVRRSVSLSKRSAWLWDPPRLLISCSFPGSRATGTWD